MRRIAAAVFFVFSLVCSVTHLALAQSTDASVTGFVMDPSKAVIPGVTVTAIDTDTNAKFETHTDKSGSYVLPSLPAGPYRMQIEKPGFKTILKEDLDLHVQAALEINFQMAVGSTSESVTVTGSEGEVQTGGAVSTVIDQTEIANMPLNGNSLSTLFELTPGVVTNAGGSPSNGGGISVDGQRPTSNSLSVDGTSGNLLMAPGYGPNVVGGGFASSASGGTNGLLPVDAVEEFRMQTSTYSAEYGRTPGGQIEVKTRGGTNEFHGSLFESFRNQVMDAQDWFIGYDNAVHGEDLKQSPLRMNDFGGTFGGPILKNRLFFFAAHESLLMDQPQSPETLDVPDQQTVATAASVFQPYLNSYPAGNGGPDPNNPGSDIYIFPFSNTIHDHSTSARLDAELPHNLRAFFRVNDAPSSSINPYPAYTLNADINILTLTSGLSWNLSAHALNDFTVNYSAVTAHSVNAEVPQTFVQAASGLLNNTEAYVAATFNPWPNLNVGPLGLNHLHQFNLVDTFSWALGRHVLTMGMDYRQLAPSLIQPTPQLILLTGYSTGDIESGNIDYLIYVNYFAQPIVKSRNLSLFSQDTWQIHPRLHLDFGLRWEFDPPPTGPNPGLLAMQGNPNDPSTITLAPSGTALYQTRYANFAPRLGFAYTARNSARFGTVIRGGGGIFYDTGQAAAAAQAAGASYPYSGTASLQNVLYSSINVSQLQSESVALGLPQYELFLTQPNLLSPRTYNWSLTFDQKLGEKTLLSTSYVGNSAHDLLKDNAFQGLSPSLTSGYLYVYTNGENSSYNALQMQLRNRATKRLNILASYTFAHALDNGSNDFESVAGYYKNYKADSDNDIRQIFASAIHYSPQGLAETRFLKVVTGGWSLDTIALLQSAAPLSVYSHSTINTNPNLYNTYADIVPGVPTVISNPSAPGGKQLNPAAFIAAPGTRDGTSARNGYRLFGLAQWDLAASRSWPLWEGSNMTFRVDAFNIVNTPSFSGVDTGLGDPTFGQATSTYASQNGGTDAGSGSLNRVFSNGGARSLQLSLRIKF